MAMVSHNKPASGTNTLTINVGLSGPSGKIIRVDYATTDGSATAPADHTAASGTLTFSPGDQLKSVDIDVAGDATTEPDETFTLALSAPTNATLSTQNVTITPSDQAGGNTEIWVWGDNYYGGCGTGGKQPVHFPMRIAPQLDGAQYVVNGINFVVVLAGDGRVWAWGQNDNGQLGHPTAGSERLTPERIPGLSNIVQIAVVGYCCFARTNSAEVYAWGNNGNGEGYLGLGASPSIVGSLTTHNSLPPIVDIDSFCAVDATGNVWTWGRGDGGQIGDGLFSDQPTPMKVPGLTGVVDIVGIGGVRFATTSSGEVYAWGVNNSGCVGNGADQHVGSPSNHAAIQGFAQFFPLGTIVFARKPNGEMYVWGNEYFGGMGFGSPVGSPTGDVLAPIRAPHLDGFQMISGGGSCYGIDDSGQVWVWGENDSPFVYQVGLLGLGHNNDVPTPVRLGGISAAPRSRSVGFGSGSTAELKRK